MASFDSSAWETSRPLSRQLDDSFPLLSVDRKHWTDRDSAWQLPPQIIQCICLTDLAYITEEPGAAAVLGTNLWNVLKELGHVPLQRWHGW